MKITPFRTAVVVAVLGATATACSSAPMPSAVTSTSSPGVTSSSSPAASATSSSPTSGTQAPAPAVATPAAAALTAASSDALRARAESYGAAVSAGAYAEVATMACPGLLRGQSADEYAAALANGPGQTLALAEIDAARPGAEDVAELVDPGVEVDRDALVAYTVRGDTTPNPTLVARFVQTSGTWLYCGALPNG